MTGPAAHDAALCARMTRCADDKCAIPPVHLSLPVHRAAVISAQRASFVILDDMKGLLLTADLYRCRCEGAWLTDAAKLGAWCLSAVEAVGLQPVNQLFHAFPANQAGVGRVSVTVV